MRRLHACSFEATAKPVVLDATGRFILEFDNFDVGTPNAILVEFETHRRKGAAIIQITKEQWMDSNYPVFREAINGALSFALHGEPDENQTPD